MTKTRYKPVQRMRSLQDRAVEVGVVEKTLVREIGRGALAAHKIGRQWRIADEDWEEYLRQRRRG